MRCHYFSKVDSRKHENGLTSLMFVERQPEQRKEEKEVSRGQT